MIAGGNALKTNGQKASFLCWMFASGIPREIKRNVVLCEESSLELESTSAVIIWQHLFRCLLESISYWALQKSNDDHLSYSFLLCIEKTKAGFPLSELDYNESIEWVHNLLSIWSIKFGCDIFIIEKGKDSNSFSKKSLNDISFKRAFIEIALCSTGIILSNYSSIRDYERLVPLLKDVFRYIPNNLQLAETKTNQYLKLLGVIDLKSEKESKYLCSN